MAKLDPGRYSLWVHFGMASMVGVTMIAVGCFIAWRVEYTRQTLDRVESHLDRQDEDAETLLSNQLKILKAVSP